MPINLMVALRVILSLGIGIYAIPCARYAYHLLKGLVANDPHESMTVTFRGRELTGTNLYLYAAAISLIPVILLGVSLMIWPRSAEPK